MGSPSNRVIRYYSLPLRIISHELNETSHFTFVDNDCRKKSLSNFFMHIQTLLFLIPCVDQLFLFLSKIEAGPDQNSADLKHMERRVQILERKLKKEQKEGIRLKAIRSREALHRTEMEDFFMQCIEVCNHAIWGTKPESSHIQKNPVP